MEINVDGEKLIHLCLDDDTVLISDSVYGEQKMLYLLQKALEKVGLEINFLKMTVWQ